MTETRCEEIRELMSLDGVAAAPAAHLETCAGCRDEARSLEAILGELASSSSMEPPAALDRRVRRRLRGARAPRPLLLPAPAVVLALLALAAGTAGLGLTLGQTSVGETGAAVAVGALLAWLSLSSTVALPLLARRAAGSAEKGVVKA